MSYISHLTNSADTDIKIKAVNEIIREIDVRRELNCSSFLLGYNNGFINQLRIM